MDQNVLLKMTGITKTFPGVKALDGVNFELKAGTVHALMGENGAGKSTLMKCLFGIYAKDGGQILLDGKEINFKSSKEALENGVAMVHQELNQALKRSVMDNIWLGRYPKIGGIMVDEKKMYKDTKAVFDELGIDVDPHRIMSTMSVSQRQMVEIAKAVSYNSKIIVFDEPTSSLTEQEVEHLFEIINMLRERGVGIIYISHKMAEIKRISDYITVMRDGKWIATDHADNLEMADIIRLMVGRELTNQFPPKTNVPGDVVLEVQNVTGLYNQLQDVSTQEKARSSDLRDSKAPAEAKLLKVFSVSAPERAEQSLLTENLASTATLMNPSRTASLFLPKNAAPPVFSVFLISRITPLFQALNVTSVSDFGSAKNPRGKILSIT